MSVRATDGRVGHKRPPEGTRWKKGQCGNPKRKYKRRRAMGTQQIVDTLLLENVTIVENGIRRRATTFEAIVTRLWVEEMAGDKRAIAVRIKFQEFAASQRRPDNRKREIIIESLS